MPHHGRCHAIFFLKTRPYALQLPFDRVPCRSVPRAQTYANFLAMVLDEANGSLIFPQFTLRHKEGAPQLFFIHSLEYIGYGLGVLQTAKGKDDGLFGCWNDG